MDRLQRTCKPMPMILYLLFFFLLSLGHHAYRFHELQCIQVRAVGFWTHTLYEILGNLGLYTYNKYPFSNYAPAISEKNYYQPISLFRQPGVELESMTQKISSSQPNGGINVYLLAFIAPLVAPIIAVLSAKIMVVLCAFVASVTATSITLVSAILGWDVISEFLHGIALTSPAYVPFAMMLFAPALATYYLALEQRPLVCLFDFALYHIPYENSLFNVTEEPDTGNDSTRSSIRDEDDNDVEEIPREDLEPETSSGDLARIDQTYNYGATPPRGDIRIGHLPIRTGHLPIRTGHLPIRTGHLPIRTGHLPIRTNNMPWRPVDFSILSEISESSDTAGQALTPLIYPSLHERNTNLSHNNSSTRNKILPTIPSLSAPTACKKIRALSTTNSREQLGSIIGTTQNIPSSQPLVFMIAMWALPTQLMDLVPMSRELVVRCDLRKVLYRWWLTQLSEATMMTAPRQLVLYFNLQDFVTSWAKSHNLLLSLSARQACFLDLEYAHIFSNLNGNFTFRFAIPSQSAITQTSDRPLYQLDMFKLITRPSNNEKLEQALPESEVRPQVLPTLGTKSLTYGEKSEDQPSLENDSIPEAQPPSETVPTPRVRQREQRKHRSRSELIAYLNLGPDTITLEPREYSDRSPAQRERRHYGFWPRYIKGTRRPVVYPASQLEFAPCYGPQPFFDDEASDTSSESPTSVTDGAVSDFAEVAERDQIPSLPSSGSPTAVIDGAAGDITGVADVRKNVGQQLPATKKGKKSKGKGKANDRGKAQAFSFRRQFFEEHRFAAKREGVIDLDVLATLSEGMNGRNLLDVAFLIAKELKHTIGQADFEAAIARQHRKMEGHNTDSTSATPEASNASGSSETQKDAGVSSSAKAQTSDRKSDRVDALPPPSASTIPTSAEALHTSGSVSQPPGNKPAITDASGSTSSSLKPASPAITEPSHSSETQAPSKSSNDNGALGFTDLSDSKFSFTSDFMNSDSKAVSGKFGSAGASRSALHTSPGPSFKFNLSAIQDSGEKSGATNASVPTRSSKYNNIPVFNFTQSSDSEAPGSGLKIPDALDDNTRLSPRPTRMPSSKTSSQLPSSKPRLPGSQVSPPTPNNARNASGQELKGENFDSSTPDTVQSTKKPRTSAHKELPSSLHTWTPDSVKCDPAPRTSKDKSPKASTSGTTSVGKLDFSTSTPPLSNNFFDKPMVRPTPTEKENSGKLTPQSNPTDSEPRLKFTCMANLGKPIKTQGPTDGGIAPTSAGKENKAPTPRRIATPRGRSVLAQLEVIVRAMRADREIFADFDADVVWEELAPKMAGFTDVQIQSVIDLAIEIADDPPYCMVHRTDFESAIEQFKLQIKEGTNAGNCPVDVPDNAAPSSAGAQDPPVKEDEPVSTPKGKTRISIFEKLMQDFPDIRSSLIDYSALRDEIKGFTREDCEETVKLATKGATEDGREYLRQEDFDRAIEKRKMERSSQRAAREERNRLRLKKLNL